MSKNSKNYGGVLVCGACAVAVNPEAETMTSVDVIANAVKSFFAKAHKSLASTEK